LVLSDWFHTGRSWRANRFAVKERQLGNGRTILPFKPKKKTSGIRVVKQEKGLWQPVWANGYVTAGAEK